VGQKNGGTVKLLKRASQFLAAHFPEAKNAIEIERTLLIERLEKSPDFATTHGVIAEFSDISHLSNPLATRLASAILTNSQVHWIHDDADVKNFISDFLAKYGSVIDAVMKAELEKLVQ
jgi:ribosomal protein RSM22 (predicted rRNA methylase)